MLPESYDERMLYAAETIIREKLAKIVILGDPAKIQAEADDKGINLAGVELVNPAASPKLDQYVTDFVELRKSRGKVVSAEEAMTLLTAPDNLYYAGMMVHSNDAGGQVAGATNTTGNVLKAAFQTVGPAAGIKTVSSFFLMITKNHCLRRERHHSLCRLRRQPESGRPGPGRDRRGHRRKLQGISGC